MNLAEYLEALAPR